MLYDKVYINPIHSNFPKTKENTQSYKVIIDPSNSGTT